MNTPSPLIPQGSLQSQISRRSNVQLAVISIIAIHVVFFGGLLLQGCKRNTQTTDGGAGATNTTDNLSVAAFDTNSMYYPSPAALPTTATGQQAVAPIATESLGTPATNNYLESTTPGFGTATTAVETAPVQMKEYAVVKGDSLYKIAKTHHVTVAALKKANPNIDPDRIRVGDKINIPPVEQQSLSSTGGATGASAAGGAGEGTIYKVKAGDTLTKIARTHGTTVSALRAANGLKVSRLLVGQKLRIPATSRANGNDGAAQPAGTVNHP